MSLTSVIIFILYVLAGYVVALVTTVYMSTEATASATIWDYIVLIGLWPFLLFGLLIVSLYIKLTK